MLFACVIGRGFRPKPGHKGLFVKSPLESQKLRQSEVVCLVRKFCGFLRSFFKSSLKQGLERSSNTLRKNKKRGIAAFFCVRYQLGHLPQTPTQETFREKFLVNLQKLLLK